MHKVLETWVQSLGWEDPLENEMATHFSILAWEIPWSKKPDRLQFMGLQRVGRDTHTINQLHKLSTHETPPSSRAEGLLFLHGLESNPGSSLQTEEEAGLP